MEEKPSGVFECSKFDCVRCTTDPVCLCGPDEVVLRNFTMGRNTEPLTPQQREWCIQECISKSESWFVRPELEEMEDDELAGSVLRAWSIYVESHY